jgi:peroxiredoxin
MALTIGEAAPDFKIPCSTAELQGEFELSSNRDRNIVLAFYALDFTPV